MHSHRLAFYNILATALLATLVLAGCPRSADDGAMGTGLSVESTGPAAGEGTGAPGWAEGTNAGPKPRAPAAHVDYETALDMRASSQMVPHRYSATIPASLPDRGTQVARRFASRPVPGLTPCLPPPEHVEPRIQDPRDR